MSRLEIRRAIRTELLNTGAFANEEIDTITSTLKAPLTKCHNIKEYIEDTYRVRFPNTTSDSTAVFKLGCYLLKGGH